MSFAELIATHTNGQILILINGHNIWQHLQVKSLKSEESVEPEEERPKKKKHKPFKEMLPEEYDAYMRSNGY